jgi:putative redox protein
MTQASAKLDEGLKTIIRLGDHTLIADEPIGDGGSGLGPTAKELLVGALGACVAITVKMYAKRKGFPLEGVEIDVSMEKIKAADYPAYTGTEEFVNEFRLWLMLKGPLTQEQRARLLEIAGKCPVHRILTQPNFLIDELVLPEDSIIEEA